MIASMLTTPRLKKRVDREGEEQAAFFKWLDLRYPAVDNHTFHIPNGGNRSRVTGAKMKREGVKKGVPDIFVAFPVGEYHGLFIEMKAPAPHSSSVTQEQKNWLAALSDKGYRAVVCKGYIEAKRTIEEYLGHVVS